MLMTMESWLGKTRRTLGRALADPRVMGGVRLAFWAGSGFFLAALNLGGYPYPVAMGLCCSLTGWGTLATALGAMLGFRLYWGGGQGIAWILTGGVLSWAAEKYPLVREEPTLLPAAAAFATAALGLVFQVVWEDNTPLLTFALRTTLAFFSVLLFRQVQRRRDSLYDWILGGVAVMALAQGVPYSLGYVLAGTLAVGSAFPAAVMAGLGLDLAQVTKLPMTAVLCGAYFLRMVPFQWRYLRYCAPAAAGLALMALLNVWDLTVLPGLLLGGAAGALLPPKPQAIHRRGTTGAAQVRLELASAVLQKTGALLREEQAPEIDEEALLQRVRDRACAACSARERCLEQEKLTGELLRYPLEFRCRKQGRIQGELRRSQEQLRLLKSDHNRRREYRLAMAQQYEFLWEFLQRLSDQLPRQESQVAAAYTVEVSARSAGKERYNGDSCAAFSGGGCRYYILLCDGMGTGAGAAREGREAMQLLRQLLTAGFPAGHAFRTMNSILALRGQAGAVTMDLAELRLDTGRGCLYKWGAAPSWILKEKGAQRLGGATAPPGLRIEDARESRVGLSLRRGEILILSSDGADPGRVLRRREYPQCIPTGELAEDILRRCREAQEDDATVAVVRLRTAGG